MKKQTEPQSQNDYNEQLQKRKEEHLAKVAAAKNEVQFQPCMHDACPECVGTGVKINGAACIHYIHCTCAKCSPVSFRMSMASKTK